MPTPLKLHLGCGSIYLEGYVNIDGYPTEVRGHTKSVADRHLMIEDLDYPANAVDEIYTSHTVEHLSGEQLLKAFPCWFNTLKPGGKLIIEVPDAEAIMHRLLQQTREEDRDLYYYLLFGTQEFEGEFHKTGWTYPRLRRALTYVGFTKFVDGAKDPTQIANRWAYEAFAGRRWRAVLLQCEKPDHPVTQRVEQLRAMLLFEYREQDLRSSLARTVARVVRRRIRR